MIIPSTRKRHEKSHPEITFKAEENLNSITPSFNYFNLLKFLAIPCSLAVFYKAKL